MIVRRRMSSLVDQCGQRANNVVGIASVRSNSCRIMCCSSASVRPFQLIQLFLATFEFSLDLLDSFGFKQTFEFVFKLFIC